MRYFRAFMFFICAFQAFFAVAFILRLPLAEQVWPLSYTNQMSFLFIGSIFAAAAASTFWCIAAREYGALSGIALDYLAIFIPMGIFALQLTATSQNEALRNFSIACVIGVVFGIGLLLWSRRIPLRDSRPLPRLVRWSFIVIIIALVIAGAQLVLKIPDVLPWNISDVGSVIYGWIFFGAAIYFTYTLVRPGWHNAVGQLAGFLAYDLVLIVPFINMLPTIAPERRLSLYIYTAVVVYSGLLAAYFLFVRRDTRIIRSSRPL